MGWVIAIVIAAYIAFRLNTYKIDGNGEAEKMIKNKLVAQKEKDEFAGNSVGAFFLLEELVDPGNSKSIQMPNRRSLQMSGRSGRRYLNRSCHSRV